jgi:hypothetical protein
MRPLLMLVVGVALGVGCYNPRLGEGDFVCGAAGACPSGWKCGPDNRCYRNVTSANFDANPRDTRGADTVVDVTPPPPPVDANMCMRGLTCSPGASAGRPCDLVCQTGCGCADRCTIAETSAICRPLTANPTPLYDKCSPDNDTCTAGAVCVPEVRYEACGAHCYRACRVDADCGPTSRCNEALLTPNDTVLTKICGPAIEQCNPVGLAGMRPPCADVTKRPLPNFACYLLDAGAGDSAVCDCAGTLELGAACKLKRECVPGLECLPAGPAGDLRCRQLCNLGLGVAACPPATTCRGLGTSTKIGVCL